MSAIGEPTKKPLYAAIFILPALLLYVLFLVYPLISSLWGSLFDWNGLTRGGFIGVTNFARLFDSMYLPRLLGAFNHNVLWFLGIMVLENGVGLIFAHLLYQAPVGHKVYRTLYFIPATLSPIVVGALWRLLLHPSGGLVNKLLMWVGILKQPFPWLGESSTALASLIFVDAWNWIGFPMLVFLAGMNDIPPEVLEASYLDGASRFKTLVRVVLPLIVPSITTISVLTIINTFNTFDTVYIMEGLQGNPYYSTDVLGTMFYRLAFGAQGGSGITETGLSLALATMMFIFIVLATVLVIKVLQRREVRF